MPRQAALALLIASACASDPAPRKMSWSEAGVDLSTEEAEENAVAAPSLPPDEVQKLSPLAQSTARFAGVERALRCLHANQPMPGDAVAAWSGLFAAIDQTVLGRLPCNPGDLMRARLAARAELSMDEQSYNRVPPGLPAAVQARLQELAEKLRRGRLAARAAEELGWPLSPVVITSQFGARLDPIDHHTWKAHEGVDLAAPPGQLVMAAGRGVVVDAGWKQGYGLTVMLRHPDGTLTRYGHLSQLLTRMGLPLNKGGAVGLVGSTGHSTGPHLHFEIWRGGRALDPLSELGDPEVADDAPVAANP